MFTHTRVHDNIPRRRLLKYADRCSSTHLKPSAGMPGPEGPAHRSCLGVVTGISAASTGGVLVFTVSSNAVHVIQFTFTLA